MREGKVPSQKLRSASEEVIEDSFLSELEFSGRRTREYEGKLHEGRIGERASNFWTCTTFIY